uniref:Nicolin 1 n=1 Tax=Tetraodon nigroviridis TaxID=99883 RepID=H3C5I4_TETNG
MEEPAASCTVKPAVALSLGAEAAARSGVRVLDVAPPPGQALDIDRIVFRNFYTASVTVRVLHALALMADPHTEAGSQDQRCIRRTQMRVAPDHVTSVRLILRQPSCVWRSFTLEDIRIYPRSSEPNKQLSDWLSELAGAEPHLDLRLSGVTLDPAELPDAASVSSSLQQMWALTEVMQSQRSSASVGRFDVDGCYRPHFLSLT